jgi:hypothetical protein
LRVFILLCFCWFGGLWFAFVFLVGLCGDACLCFCGDIFGLGLDSFGFCWCFRGLFLGCIGFGGGLLRLLLLLELGYLRNNLGPNIEINGMTTWGTYSFLGCCQLLSFSALLVVGHIELLIWIWNG